MDDAWLKMLVKNGKLAASLERADNHDLRGIL
jgi:hypothetical protein